MLELLYLVPNLSDPAVSRRVDMLRAGGARISVAGFRRADAAPAQLTADRVMELGVTHDARMLHRLLATLKASYTARGWGRTFNCPDVIVARNLEMLAVANRLLSLWPSPPALVYECLDLHRLMLREDQLGRAMRRLEHHFMQPAGLLLTSSPAFLANHFDRQSAPPAMLVENKVLVPAASGTGRNPALEGAVEPLRLGWFGALRCRKSLAALDAVSRALAGKVRVTLRGRPALTEFDDFHATTARSPFLDYAGAYRYPDDLSSIYSGVHFVWAIDCFEEGQNSAWLLPNRIYEGCLNGAIPIALAGTETAAFIERLGIGIVVSDIEPATLVAVFDTMSPQRLGALARAVAALDPSLFRCDPAECEHLVNRLSRLADVRPEVEIAA